MNSYKNTFEDVWKYINKGSLNDCWEWIKSLNTGGYGKIKINGKTYRSHRIVYELTFGKIPDGLLVCHKCDNPPCCRPSHLFLGSHSDNRKDAQNKNRVAYGERCLLSKLTKKDVQKMRKVSSGKSLRELATMFGTCRSNVHAIIHNKTWVRA